MDKRNVEETRNAILEAAKELMMECEDPGQVTARGITTKAGVNLAMINYCFGSKEALLFQVFQKMQEEASMENPNFAKILNSRKSPKEKLIEVTVESAKFMLANEAASKAIVKYVLLERPISGERGSVPLIMEYFQGKKSEMECRKIAFELSALQELVILRHEELKEVCGIDLKNEKDLRNLVTEHVNRYLHE